MEDWVPGAIAYGGVYPKTGRGEINEVFFNHVTNCFCETTLTIDFIIIIFNEGEKIVDFLL